MNNILNIVIPPILYSFYALPLLYIIYLCNRIVRRDEYVKQFIKGKNNILILIIYILFPPFLWYRLTRLIIKGHYVILCFAITLFLFLWFIALLENLSYFFCKIHYGIYYTIFSGILIFYIVPILFIFRFFKMKRH